MANLFDYLDWRGDLTLDQVPFNDIDSLILSRLSYLPFDGIVPQSLQESITIAKASERFFASKEAHEHVIMQEDIPLLQEVANSGRFGPLNLLGYVNQVDLEEEKQFAAVVIQMSPDCHYVSFRGTDLTLVGWKEDFNMSFTTPVPAQEEAVRYLEQVGTTLTGNFVIGGHSKGGNLAVYAAAFCSEKLQGRILAVYNNDGPGFDSAVLATDGYQRIREKIKTFVPQSSVVGMLLQHEEDYFVIHSTQIGLMQHDLYSWEVERDQFVYLDTVTDGSKFIDQTLKTWVANLEPGQRELFVDALFSIFEQTKATSLKELTENWYTNARIILKSLRDMDDAMRQTISETLRLLLKSARQNIAIPGPKVRRPS
mgnify:CR=1 FL=1